MSECDFIRFPFVVFSWSILLEIIIITNYYFGQEACSKGL